MSEIGKLKVSEDGDRAIVMTRLFEAPREEVFDAYTKPELVQHWLGCFGGWSMTACEIEPRVGGVWRFVWTGPDGKRMGWRAICREFVAPERIASSATFDEPWFPGAEEGKVTFEERGGRTALTMRVSYESREVRDDVLGTSMPQGVAMSYDKLEELLAAPADQWMEHEAGVP